MTVPIVLELRIRPRDVRWDVELWRDGKLRESYYGEPSLQEAVDRGISWLRAARER